MKSRGLSTAPCGTPNSGENDMEMDVETNVRELTFGVLEFV